MYYLLKKFYFLQLFFISFLFASSDKFFLEQNHYSKNQISEFALMSQRCSGSNYLEALIKRNFPSYFFHSSNGLGLMPHKHHWSYINYSEFSSRDKCLYILLVRNPYDQLRSLYQHKEILPWLNRSNFSNFLYSQYNYRTSEMTHRSIQLSTKMKYDNILQARNEEISNYLNIGSVTSNFLVVRYEDVSNDPEGFINFLAEYFHLKKVNNFIDVTTYKGGKMKYEPKNYNSLMQHELNFINNNLDWEVENTIKYYPIFS